MSVLRACALFRCGRKEFLYINSKLSQRRRTLTGAWRAWFKLRSVAAMMNGNGTAAQQILALTAAFRDRGLSFRHYPLAKCAELRWQAGREVTEPITLPDGDVRFVHRFELVGWASTSGELINQLA
jgi:hypothetical protein